MQFFADLEYDIQLYAYLDISGGGSSCSMLILCLAGNDLFLGSWHAWPIVLMSLYRGHASFHGGVFAAAGRRGRSLPTLLSLKNTEISRGSRK